MKLRKKAVIFGVAVDIYAVLAFVLVIIVFFILFKFSAETRHGIISGDKLPNNLPLLNYLKSSPTSPQTFIAFGNAINNETNMADLIVFYCNNPTSNNKNYLISELKGDSSERYLKNIGYLELICPNKKNNLKLIKIKESQIRSSIEIPNYKTEKEKIRLEFHYIS